jgi:hypothetical protein
MSAAARAADLPGAGMLTRPVRAQPRNRFQSRRLIPVREVTALLSQSPLTARAIRAAALPWRVVLAAGILICPALARDDGRFNQLPVDLRAWFRSQKSPVTGEYCCDEADGTYVEEDIREGHYWVRWSTVWQWQRVPDEVIINGPNRVGLPVVWWHYDHRGVSIRCFVPGGKT